jgi:hypothetical protein
MSCCDPTRPPPVQDRRRPPSPFGGGMEQIPPRCIAIVSADATLLKVWFKKKLSDFSRL